VKRFMLSALYCVCVYTSTSIRKNQPPDFYSRFETQNNT